MFILHEDAGTVRANRFIDPIAVEKSMVEDGDHLVSAKAREVVRGAGTCVICGKYMTDALYHGGQFWCRPHEHLA